MGVRTEDLNWALYKEVDVIYTSTAFFFFPYKFWEFILSLSGSATDTRIIHPNLW